MGLRGLIGQKSLMNLRRLGRLRKLKFSTIFTNLPKFSNLSLIQMKKPPMGSTKAYVPLVALIEAPQMRRYHEKLLAHFLFA